MTNELLLLRHAKSDWSVDMDDFSRPLNKRGRYAAKYMGHWLNEQGLIPDMILCSPAMRTVATAQRVCKQLDIDESAIVYDPRIYEANAQTLLEVLKTRCHERRVLLIGHNPGLEDLLFNLISYSVPLSFNEKHLPTAALAQLNFEGNWTDLTEHCATLITLIRPEQRRDED